MISSDPGPTGAGSTLQSSMVLSLQFILLFDTHMCQVLGWMQSVPVRFNPCLQGANISVLKTGSRDAL